MAKSMYSLMLMDDLVEKIDQLAYEKNTNRSNLINQILAEHLRYETPEMRMTDIFDSITSLLSDRATFQVSEVPRDAMLSIKSNLRYKYRPTMRYSVELYRQNGDCFGELRIAFRTKSPELLHLLDDFFRLFVALETKHYAPVVGEGRIHYALEKGRFRRTLLLPADEGLRTNESLGAAITEYITMLDDLLKNAVSGEDVLKQDVERRYRTYLKHGITMI